ncbi:uncharacterized protein LOC130713222 [Lotus japonicus]|uniref:uncharacterized protein LOC130713222 n=1 Tax=Lotus japonicus TaxID=34305 RepID=UPI0025844F72|nr:uncharacterized protein LOC130713222 [Lotus japonicus]
MWITYRCGSIKIFQTHTKSFNTAPVSKNWWRIYNNLDSLFGQVFKSVYFPSGELLGAKKGYRPSYAWTSMLKTSCIFVKGGRWRVGNGESINIVDDPWLPNGSPLIFRQDLFEELGLRKVVGLLVSGRWNEALVEQVFNPATAQCILAVPLPVQAREDLLFWPKTQDGWYNAKSGYKFIRRIHDQVVPSSSSTPVIPAAFWKVVWSSTALPRCRELVSRASSGFFPVRSRLRRRGIDVDPSCPWCGIDDETTSHSFLLCPVIARLWFAVLGIRPAGTSVFYEMLTCMMEHLEDEAVSRIFTMLYVIWEARNAWVFNQRELHVTFVMQRLVALSALPRPVSVTSPAVAGASSWKRPHAGLIKVNFDASVRRNLAGIGLVARDEDGEVLAAATLAMVLMQSVGLAEALCFRWALQMAIDLGFRAVCFETDSLQLFQWWLRRSRGSSYLDLIISDCRTLSLAFSNMDVSFVRRSGNSAADFLARGASSFLVWIEEGPPGLDAFVRSDILASKPALFQYI